MKSHQGNPAPAQEAGGPSGAGALPGLTLSMLLASLGVSIPNVALPELAQSFQAPFGAVQWVILAYLLALTVMIVSAGRLGDILGHRRMLMTGIALFTLASLGCGLAPSLPWLIAARAVQGLGGAVLMALTGALVRETVSKDRLGRAMGLLGTFSAIGTALGPSLGGLLLAGPGWRAIFLILVPLGLLALALSWRFLPAGDKGPAGLGRAFDKSGTLLLGLALGVYLLAVTMGSGRFNGLNAALMAAAFVLGLLFLRVEAGAVSPLIRLASFRDAPFSAALAANVIVGAVMMSTLVIGPFFLARGLGLADVAVGAVMAVGPVISALTGYPAGRLVDRLGASFMVKAGLALMAMGALALSQLPGFFGLPGYLAAIALLTPGYQLFQAANNTAVMADVDPGRKGVVSGMLGLARNLGLMTGASVMGALFALAAGRADITNAAPAAVAAGMQTAFGLSGLMVILAFLLVLAASRQTACRPSG